MNSHVNPLLKKHTNKLSWQFMRKMMKHMAILLSIIPLGLALVACQSETEPTAIPEAVEEAATAVPTPTTEPTAVPEPTEEPDIQPTTEETPPQPTDRPVVEPPSPETAGILPMDHFYIDAAGLAATWGHTIEQGTTLDLNYPPGNNGIPPHIVVSFGGPDERAVHPGPFSPNVAQARILPVQAYLDMYEAAGSDTVKTRLDTLTAILEERPETIEGVIPVLPAIGAGQVVQGKTSYIDFNGGSGVGFVATYAQGITPFFDDSLSYIFQGLTDDGQQWISFVWPLTVNFLPSIEESTTEYQSSADSDPAAYLEEVNQLIEDAVDSDYIPVLVALNQMMESMIIGEAAQAEKPPSPNIFGLKWQYEQYQDMVELNDMTVSNPENYELILWTDATYNIKADCNVGNGSYTMSGTSLSLMPGPMTLAECGPDSLGNQFLEQLSYVRTYVTDEGQLVLNLFADAGNMIFTNAGPVPYEELVAYGRAGVGVESMDPSSVSIDTMDLPYSWQTNVVEGTLYDESQPPGAKGLPEHLQVNFGVSNPADVQFGDPILYIIPTEAYKALWDEAGNSVVSERLSMLEELLADRPDLATARLPVLPFEAFQVMGAGNLGVIAQREYLDAPWGTGVRFLTTPMQDINPILNRNVVYIEQGLTDDGEYLVSFFYPPVSTQELPDSVEEVSEEEFQQAQDWATYLPEKEAQLDSLSPSEWEPELTTLDEVIGSLQFGDYG
jgi:heat shock protein HslJ